VATTGRGSDMPELADCYVLVKSPSKKRVEEFLAHFMPRRWPLADEYEMPQYSDKPEEVFRTSGEALSYLEEHPNQGHALYWQNQDSEEPRCGMIFPTTDGQMIYGLSCRADDEGTPGRILDAMKHFLQADIGYIAFEEPPPETTQEFMDRVNSTKNR
jgi:hypothetical protein